MHEIHGGGHIWNAWTHFNLEHGSLLIITVLRLDYPVDSGHGPAPSVHLHLPLCGAAALLSALAIFLDDFLIGLRVFCLGGTAALPCASVPEFLFSFGGAVATLLEVLLGFGGTAAILSATVIVSL